MEQKYLNDLFEKYVPTLIDMIIEGIVDGRQGERLKMVVPQTDLNMVRTLLRCGEREGFLRDGPTRWGSGLQGTAMPRG